MWWLVLAELACGTGNSGLKSVRRRGDLGWSGRSGRSHENAVVNSVATIQRRCNDRELSRMMEPQLEPKYWKHININWWEPFSSPLREKYLKLRLKFFYILPGLSLMPHTHTHTQNWAALFCTLQSHTTGFHWFKKWIGSALAGDIFRDPQAADFHFVVECLQTFQVRRKTEKLVKTA